MNRRDFEPAFDDCRSDPREGDPISALRARIDCTRLHMDETLDELQHRLTPRYMAEQAMNRIKDTGRNTGHFMADSIRQHPVPAMMAGVGLAWLMYEALRDRRDVNAHFAADLYRHRPGPTTEHGASHAIAEGARTLFDRTKQAVGSLAEQSQATMESVRDSASQVASAAAHRFQEAGSAAKETLRSGVEHSRDALRRSTHAARDTATKVYEDYPLATGGAALAVGIAMGLALPSTRREDELVGQVRDDLLDGSEQTAMKLIRAGTQTVSNALHSTLDRAVDAADDAADDLDRQNQSQGT
jgi:hypothetical protein